jgi:single-stranded DNA-binding protein
VSLTGTLTADPDLQEPRSGVLRCTMRLAVPRYARDGRREPGVVYVVVTTFGEDARECGRRLKLGSRGAGGAARLGRPARVSGRPDRPTRLFGRPLSPNGRQAFTIGVITQTEGSGLDGSSSGNTRTPDSDGAGLQPAVGGIPRCALHARAAL